jgi:hypothetical protein
VLESVVGAYVLSNGLSKVFKVFRKLGFNLPIPVAFKQLKDIPLPDMTHRRLPVISDMQIDGLQQILSYTFHAKQLAQFALVSLTPSLGSATLRYVFTSRKHRHIRWKRMKMNCSIFFTGLGP